MSQEISSHIQQIEDMETLMDLYLRTEGKTDAEILPTLSAKERAALMRAGIRRKMDCLSDGGRTPGMTANQKGKGVAQRNRGSSRNQVRRRKKAESLAERYTSLGIRTLPGTVHRQFIKRDGRTYGPYWYWYRREGGRQTRTYLRDDEAEVIMKLTQARRKEIANRVSGQRDLREFKAAVRVLQRIDLEAWR